ncbi:MAG: hypothetical protein C0600_06700 [Ignavibacteria bacterium]|mgnify:CR=1 FL=1|nr:MAG: hypothetical protein C0600_06700 [Ignavibacteria bacterium]
MTGINGRGKCSPAQIRSWIDLKNACPQDPRELIAYAEIGAVAGDFYLSSTYASQTWGTTPLSINAEPKVTALETDNKQKVADANQWNFSHLTWNDSSSLAVPLRKIVFLRAGTEWENAISFDFGGTAIEEVQISFLNNAATLGDKQGSIPVIR